MPLVGAGKMPNLAWFLEEGICGNMATLQPVISPMLWTSYATVKRAYKHGVHDFSGPDPLSAGIRPVTNLSRKTKAIWTILNQQGLHTITIGWWPSNPAEELSRGVMVSNDIQTADWNITSLRKGLPLFAEGTSLSRLSRRHRHRVNLAGHALHELLRIAEITFDLHVQPKARRLAEIPAQAQRCVEGDGPLAVNDFVHPARWHPQSASQRILSEPHRLHVVFQENFSRRHVVEIRLHGDRLV